MLLDLKNHLRSHGQTSLSDLVNHYRVDADALRGMLDHWVRKGRVRRRDVAADCSHSRGCCGCSGACLELYEWIDEQAAAADRRT